MGFIWYLLLGSAVYLLGFVVHRKVLQPKRQMGVTVSSTSAVMMGLLVGFFIVMMLISFMIGRWVLGHSIIDWIYILVNSAIATGVFYFGLNPDETAMKPPD